MSPTSPVTLKVLEEMGAGTVNIPADVTLDELAAVVVGIFLQDGVGQAVRLGHLLRQARFRLCVGDQLFLAKERAVIHKKFGFEGSQAR